MRRFWLTYSFVALTAVTGPFSLLSAQDTTRARPDTTKAAPDTQPAPQPAPAPALPFEFSGVIYANYQYGGAKGNRGVNRFDVERAYLNFRASPGEHFAIRVTTDLYQQRDTTRDQYYRGWAIRAKYAYAQYDFIRGIGDELKANVRVGLLHTVVIDHEETFWPRWISQVALERAGFFSSSDVGVAGLYTMNNKWGEVYATITNGSGYSSSETDRFKDFAARVSLTPFGRDSGLLRTFTITPWYYKGASASTQPATFTDGLKKDRYGIFAGLKDRRLTAGLEWAQRNEDVETITAGPPPTQAIADRKGQLIDAFGVVRPMEWATPGKKSPLGLIARYDMFKPNTASTTQPDAVNKSLIVGAFWDVNQRASFSIDYQGTTSSDYVPVAGTPPKSSTIFAHWMVAF